MRNTSCIICFKEFEPREGKLYCSNACKQKGYSDKKENQIKINEKLEIHEKIKRKKEFYFSEYLEYNKKFPNELDSFLLFCFFRKNFEGEFDLEQFNKYIKSFPSDWWDDFWNKENNSARKKYKEFEEKYFTDEVSIYFTSI